MITNDPKNHLIIHKRYKEIDWQTIFNHCRLLNQYAFSKILHNKISLSNLINRNKHNEQLYYRYPYSFCSEKESPMVKILY